MIRWLFALPITGTHFSVSCGVSSLALTMLVASLGLPPAAEGDKE